jgi:hypothetical protein
LEFGTCVVGITFSFTGGCCCDGIGALALALLLLLLRRLDDDDFREFREFVFVAVSFVELLC